MPFHACLFDDAVLFTGSEIGAMALAATPFFLLSEANNYLLFVG